MQRQSGRVVANVLFLCLGLGALLGAYAIYRVTQMPSKKKGKRRGGFRFVVRTIPAKRGAVAVSLKLTGDIVPRRTVVLRSEVSGRVRGLKLREGAPVKQGQVLAYLQSIDQVLQVRKQQAQLKQAEASVLKAKATLARERDLFTRAARLRKTRTISQQDYILARFRKATAIAALAESKALVSLRQAELAIARRDLARTRIRAPFAGTVARLHVEVGKLVNRGDLVAEIVGKRKIEARLFVPPRHIQRIQVGMKVRVRPADSQGRWQEAPLKRLLPTADANSRNRIAIVELPASRDFLPGLPVEAQVIVAQKSAALLVPKDALIRFGGAWVLYKVQKGRAMQIPVQYLNEQGRWVEVSGALNTGDAIVTVGNEALFPNAPVSTGRRKKRR